MFKNYVCVCVCKQEIKESGSFCHITVSSLVKQSKVFSLRPIPDMSGAFRAAVCCLLSVLVVLTVCHVKGEQVISKERHYYIAAVEINWDYSGNATHR